MSAIKLWIETAVAILSKSHQFKTENELRKIKEVWDEAFGRWGVTENIAKQAALFCLKNYDKWPSTKQFGDALKEINRKIKAAKEREEYLRKPRSISGREELDRLIDEGAEVSKLLKQLDFPKTPWVDCHQEIAKKLTALKKAFRANNEHKDELWIILEVKRMVREELDIDSKAPAEPVETISGEGGMPW